MTNPLDNIAAIRKVALYLGLVALAIASAMSFAFGAAMSLKHAALLGLLTFAGSIVWPYIGHLRVAGNKGKANAFALAGVLFLAVELFSHVGYSVGARVMETEDTSVQNAAYQIKQDSVDRNAETLKSLKADLADLKAQNAWAASVSADGLRAQIPAMDEAIRQETKRGGCGPKCLKLTAEKADIENRIAVAEKVDGLTSQIATVQALVNSKEETAVTAEFKSSPVVAQTKFVSQLATLELDPDQGALTWTQIAIGFLIALVTTFLAPVMIAMALGPMDVARGAREASDKPPAGETTATPTEAPKTFSAPVTAFSAPANDTRTVIVSDKGTAAKLYEWASRNEQRLSAA